MTGPITVLVVDDHELVRTGLKGVLSIDAGFDVVAEASDGMQAVAAAEVHHPDVIVMDIQMPDMDGIEATRRIVATRPATRVLMVTMFQDDDSVFAALRAGACGYVLKGAGKDELRSAVAAAAAGQSVFGAGVAARVMAWMLDRPDEPVELFPELSQREQEVLALLADDIAPVGIGRQMGIAEKTVRNHVSSILTKLHVADRSCAVELARKRRVDGPPRSERRTLVFTDIDGSTALARSLGDRYADLLTDHNRIVDGAVARHGGRCFGSAGDARFASFHDPASALRAVLAAQAELRCHQFPREAQVTVRAGVHTGVVTESGGELFGLALHETARIAAMAHPGQVVVSAEARPAEAADDGVVLDDLGIHELRDIDRPLRLFAAR